MKKLVYTFLCCLIISGSCLSQSGSEINFTKEKNIEPYPIDGTIFLQDEQQRVSEYLKSLPDELRNMKLSKTAAWGFTVGSTKKWYAADFTTNNYYQTDATCRAVGNRSYVFVEDSLWGTRVDQAAVDSIVAHFENKTPANPNKGIYDTDVETFGNVPDTDNDPRIVILILNIRDGFTGSGGYVAGYYSSLNQTVLPNSNQADMMYVDGNPSNLKTHSGLENVLATFAHEFQHMIHWNYHQLSSDLTFMNEGASEVAEVVCGYPMRGQTRYANETNKYLFNWRTNSDPNVLTDYERASRFFLNLLDQFGATVFKPLVSSTFQGPQAIEDALTKNGTPESFNDVFTNWLIANKFDDRSISTSYGYLYPNLQKVNSKQTFLAQSVSDNDQLDNLSANYYTFSGASNLKINFTADNNIIVKAIETGSEKRVINVPVNTQFNEPYYGTKYNTIHIVVINLDQNNKRNYSFQATQTSKTTVQELKWDDSEPIGFFTHSPSDTICVTFDGVQGAKLDSIRIALRRAGSITGGIYESTGNIRPTPLGKKLASPIIASISTTSPNPYPVPYQNWTTVDLRSYNISADKSFAAAFVVGSDPTTPAIMASEHKGTTAYHTFTYLHNPSGGGSPDWFFLSTSDSTVGIYLIRAYVSFGVTDAKEVLELKPNDFSLSFNYPNPFNPSTSIRYSVGSPANGTGTQFVSIKVYDLLGNEVAMLVNKQQPVGNYQIEFDGKGLSSGVYFYQLTIYNKQLTNKYYSSTKKLILLR